MGERVANEAGHPVQPQPIVRRTTADAGRTNANREVQRGRATDIANARINRSSTSWTTDANLDDRGDHRLESPGPRGNNCRSSNGSKRNIATCDTTGAAQRQQRGDSGAVRATTVPRRTGGRRKRNMSEQVHRSGQQLGQFENRRAYSKREARATQPERFDTEVTAGQFRQQLANGRSNKKHGAVRRTTHVTTTGAEQFEMVGQQPWQKRTGRRSKRIMSKQVRQQQQFDVHEVAAGQLGNNPRKGERA